MIWVGLCDRKWIVKNRCRLVEADLMLFAAVLGLILVPFESELHAAPSMKKLAELWEIAA